jgi:universal stress protein A
MVGTMVIKEILVPTDLSETSALAGQTAAKLARHFGARIHLLHVVPPITDPSTGSRALETAVAAFPPDLRIQPHAASGVPARQIVDYARRSGVDLIVMGTHGRTGFSHALLGSVAEAVMRHAPCEILVVPAKRATPTAVAEREAPAAEARCLVCATPSPDLVCEPCRTRIRGEALERKLREERAGRS